MDVGARIGARQEYMSVQIYPNRKKIFGSLSQTGSVGGHPAATAGPVWAWGLPLPDQFGLGVSLLSCSRLLGGQQPPSGWLLASDFYTGASSNRLEGPPMPMTISPCSSANKPDKFCLDMSLPAVSLGMAIVTMGTVIQLQPPSILGIQGRGCFHASSQLS